MSALVTPDPDYKPGGPNRHRGKVGHVSRKQAIAAMRWVRHWSTAGLVVYRCTWCGFWHIGHNVKTTRRQMGSGPQATSPRRKLPGSGPF